MSKEHKNAAEARQLRLPCGNNCQSFKGFERDLVLLVKCDQATPVTDAGDKLVPIKKARDCPGASKPTEASKFLASPPPDS